jgi:translocation and assembly module TamB
MKRKTARRLKIAGALVLALALFTIMALVTLSSPWFHEKVRQRIVAELERVTGGTAIVGSWVFNWQLLTVEFSDLTLHGSEPANVPPLVRARSIKVGLKIISFWKRNVDIESLLIVEPQVNLIVAADGSTNIPAPKIMRQTGKVGFEPLLDWKIAKFTFENGTLLLAETKHDISARGENLQAKFSYDFSGPRYKGQLSMQPLRFNARGIAPFDTDVYLVLGLEKNRIEVSSAKFDLQRSQVEATGVIEDLSSPKAAFQFTGHLAADQAAPILRIRGVTRGMIELAGGSFHYNSATDYTIASSVRARDLDVLQDGIRFSGVRATSMMRLNSRGMKLTSLVVDVLGGRFIGEADFPELRRFVLNGTAQSIPIQQALNAFAPQLPPAGKKTWSGVATGPVRVEGNLGGGPIIASANVSIAPAPGGIPVQGSVDGRYDGRSRTLSLGKSYVVTPAGRLDVTGALGEQVQVQAASTNLDELLPVINAFSKSPVNSLPVQLKNGKATFTGTVTGKLSSPQIAGAVTATSFTFSGIDFDSFAGQVKLDESSLNVQDGKLARGGARPQISGSVGMTDWKIQPASPITAAATLSGGEISELLTLAGQKQIPVRGGLAVSARISGTVESPRATADITVTTGVAYDEPFDRLQASVEYSPQLLAVRQVRLVAGPAQITGSASFEPTRPGSGMAQFRDGRLVFQVTTNDMSVQRFRFLRRQRPDIMGVVRTSFQGAATLHDRGAGRSPETLLTSLNGDLMTQGLRLDNRSIGNVKATAKTEASVLKVQVDSNFLNSNLVATGQWRLVPGYPGEASAHFSEVSLGMVREWLAKPGERTALNFDGSAEGAVTIAGPALDPREWKASAQLSKVEIHPQEQGAVATPRFSLRNEGLVSLTMEKSILTVASAHFTGPLTDVRVTGTALIQPKPSLDLRLNGDVNLAVARNFTRDIETEGAAKINASVRGPLDQPQVNGRLDVSNGSLHFPDITTGLSGASGAILFSGSQANILDFSGLVGGGKVDVSGVVGYAGGEVSYHVDVTATDVRVRYPEGASTSADAELSLRGTSQRSTLSGSISVLRTGFNPRTDFSSILGKATEPVRTPSARAGPLSSMHFDVRIETAPDISFESSFAQDIQVEGNLRLQGTPYNPVLLGRLNITQGDINFFGTRYTINQGSVTFANPVKMEPVLNVDLETRVQGIDVILTVSGPINKLNVTPRSDPPLEMSQVLALLATGSSRSSDPTLAARQTVANQGFTQLGASALIGQVVANPVSSRLQRFFGVSRLKIDPQLNGVENNPQARLTLEQQVAKNLTFTYITNLSSSNQQIVRVEWALNRRWSLIAVRDENGLFGLDFLYKKSFK